MAVSKSLGSSPLQQYASMAALAGARERIAELEEANASQAAQIAGLVSADTALDGRLDILETKTYLLSTRAAAGSATDSTFTPLTSGWSTSQSSGLTQSAGLVTIPATGLYLMTARTQFGASATGRRAIVPWVNGSENLDWAHWFWGPPNTVAPRVQFSGLIPLTAGDSVGVALWQDSGGSLTIQFSSMSLFRLA